MAISVTKPTVGGSEDTWGTTINTGLDTIVDALNGASGTVAPDLSTLTINGTDVTATAAEINTLDGVTATTAEINLLDGVTATTAELNILDGVTATASEINLLDGVTATTAEINHVDGVTSAIQTQLDAKYEAATQTEAAWEAGTSTTESLVSPAKVKSAIDELVPEGIGVNQSWSEPPRSGNTVYQNTTGKPIMVAVFGNFSGSEYQPFQVSSDNVTYVGLDGIIVGGDFTHASAIIPNNHYYKYVGPPSNWAELR